MNRSHNWMATLAIAGVAILGYLTLSASVCLAKDRDRTSTSDFEWSGKLTNGQVLAVRGVNGAVRARSSADGSAQVRATKRFRRSDPNDVRIEVEEGAKGITICAIYPGGRDCDHLTADGRRRSNDIQVDFEVEVPAGVQLAASTVNGQIEALGLKADAEVSTVNGSIEVETTGVAEASTVNGSIRASIGAQRWPRSLDFSTVNGAITLRLPAEPNAELSASTVNGSISTDFPLTIHGKFGRRSVSGTLGKGGPALNLSTVNGTIALRSGGDS